MVIGFTILGFGSIKSLRIRYRGLIFVGVRFSRNLFFLVLRVSVLLDDIWRFFFFILALVERVILVWIWQSFPTPKAWYGQGWFYPSSSTCTWLILWVWVDKAPWFLRFFVACEGNWSIKVTCLPFLSIVNWTFVLTKSWISSTREFILVICSISCEIAPRIGSDAGVVWHGACMYACGWASGTNDDCLWLA